MSKGNQIYYCQPVFRPPSEANSLLIQVPKGAVSDAIFVCLILEKSF